MKKMVLLSSLAVSILPVLALYALDHKTAGAASFAGSKTLVLYDAASGTIPGMPLVGFMDFPQNAAMPAYIEGVTVMDTTTAGSDTYAGWVATGAATPGFPILDRATGFQVNFTLQVENESHASNHRAGFSCITLGADAKGIELSFWEDQIWAQSDESTGGLFRQGEGVAFATTTGLTDYQVTVAGDTYTLTANGETILAGPVRDYRAFNGFPDPYETPNFLFLGDDTTSALARVRLSFISITGSEPETPPVVTSASTGTNDLLTTVSPPPPASATSISSPTSTGTAFEVCPSGWILLAVLLTTASIARKTSAG